MTHCFQKSLAIQVAAALCGLMAASGAYANYFCTGPVVNVVLSPSGLVTVNAPAAAMNFVYLCQIGATYNGVGSDSCKAILSTLLAARVSAQPITVGYSDSLTCSTHPAWAALTGWYYGPQL
jgi:hypothetical protein